VFDDFENIQYLAIFRLPRTRLFDNSRVGAVINNSKAPETLPCEPLV
jgi:hypothetical protein